MKYICNKCGEEKDLNIKQGDVFEREGRADSTVLAIVGEAIIMDVALNDSWSNKVYSASQFVQNENWKRKETKA